MYFFGGLFLCGVGRVSFNLCFNELTNTNTSAVRVRWHILLRCRELFQFIARLRSGWGNIFIRVTKYFLSTVRMRTCSCGPSCRSWRSECRTSPPPTSSSSTRTRSSGWVSSRWGPGITYHLRIIITYLNAS